MSSPAVQSSILNTTTPQIDEIEASALVLRVFGLSTRAHGLTSERDRNFHVLGSVKNLGRYAASWIAGWPNRPSSTAALT